MLDKAPAAYLVPKQFVAQSCAVPISKMPSHVR